MKTISLILALITTIGSIGSGARAATESKKLLVNVHVQANGMPRVAHFGGELPLGGSPQRISRIPTYQEPDLSIVDFYDINSAFSGWLPRFLVDVSKNSFGADRLCVQARGNIDGLNVNSNFASVPGGYHEGYGESEFSCFDVEQVEKVGGVYLVYQGEPNEPRKRLAIYLNVVMEN